MLMNWKETQLRLEIMLSFGFRVETKHLFHKITSKTIGSDTLELTQQAFNDLKQ